MPEREPLDEDAAWAEIVAAYDEETAEPEPLRRLAEGRAAGGPGEPAGGDVRGATGAAGRDEAEQTEGTEEAAPDRASPGASDPSGGSEAPGTEGGDGRSGPAATDPGPPRRFGPDTPVNSVLVFSAGDGPRDWEAAEPDEDDDHFVPPEPPPLPPTDLTTKMAWTGAIGGPLLLIGAVLFQQPITWWMWTLGIGGFLGGFVTLIARMGDDDEDGFDDPGRGAVV